MPNNSRFDSRALLDNRQVRIFLSSTFSDMEAERTALLHTFDTLRVKARRRNVDLAVLDLRWGVTDEEARSGKVVSVCLNEIEHSHPFFIGLLGSRYGYAPEAGELDKNPDLLERYPWLADDIAAGRSITEMEMLYGVLRNENDVDAAFYIRQNGTPDDDPRQTALKERIRGQQRYPVADYASVDELCTMVEREVTALLDRHFPDVEATPLERERTAHRAYANSLLDHFVGREEELGWLDAFVHSAERHLVVTGESGMGKSALLAEWIRRNEDSDEFNLIYHFLGNSLGSSSYESILRHLRDELYDLYYFERDSNWQEKTDDETQRLMDEVARCKKSLVIVIDGINQLSVTKDEKLLLWLPEANAQVQFIFTTLQDDATMRTFERRGYTVRTLQPLTDNQRRRFAEGYLERVGKHLSPAQWQRIISDPETRNTLVLRTLLDELICFGSHERLDARIDFYLAAQGIEDFFDRVLQRYEQDYGRDLVSRTLALLALSERGLSEEELLAIAGLRQMDWHLFYCAAYNHLVERDGLIDFAHQYMATAVATRYATADANASVPLRRATVAYFAALPPSDRRTSELAHQYYHLADWQHLHDTLVSFDAFVYFNSTNGPLLALYWRVLLAEGKDHYSLADYIELPFAPNDSIDRIYNNISVFVSQFFSDHKLAKQYLEISIKQAKSDSKKYPIAVYYANIGADYYSLGDKKKALEYYEKSLSLFLKECGDESPQTWHVYNLLGHYYLDEGNVDKAISYFKKAFINANAIHGFLAMHDINSKKNNIEGYTCISLGDAYAKKSDIDNAERYYEMALAIFNNSDFRGITKSLLKIGSLKTSQKDYLKAEKYLNSALQTYKEGELWDSWMLSEIYSGLANLYHEQGLWTECIRYYTKSIDVIEKLPKMQQDKYSLAETCNLLGRLLVSTHEFASAHKYFDKALSYYKECSNPKQGIADVYNNIGKLCIKQGDLKDALDHFKQAIEISQDTFGNEHPNVATILFDIGDSFNFDIKDNDKALNYYYQALSIRKKTFGNKHPDTALIYRRIGGVEKAQGNLENALSYFTIALDIYNNIPDQEGKLAEIYVDIADVYIDKEEYETAEFYLLKAIPLMENHLGTISHNKILFTSELKSYSLMLETLGMVQLGMLRYNEAIHYFERVLEYNKRIYGDDSNEALDTMDIISVIQSRMK